MKLVRDKVPEIILKEGKKIEMRAVKGREYQMMLMRKFQEEVEEFLYSRSPEEMADIEEVMQCIAKSKGIEWKDVEDIRKKKAEERGSFDKGIVIEKVK